MRQNETKDYLELIKEANAIFQKAYPDSILFTAVGRPNSGVAKTAGDLKKWIFNSETKLKGESTAQLIYSADEFGKPTIIGNWIGLEFEPLPQGTIRLPRAIEILNDRGYNQGFSSVALGIPVVERPQPMFWFCVDGETQGVSASTGEFFPDIMPCSENGSMGSPRE